MSLTPMYMILRWVRRPKVSEKRKALVCLSVFYTKHVCRVVCMYVYEYFFRDCEFWFSVAMRSLIFHSARDRVPIDFKFLFVGRKQIKARSVALCQCKLGSTTTSTTVGCAVAFIEVVVVGSGFFVCCLMFYISVISVTFLVYFC